MLDHRNIAELVKVNTRWDLSFFVPSQPAYMWDEMVFNRYRFQALLVAGGFIVVVGV